MKRTLSEGLVDWCLSSNAVSEDGRHLDVIPVLTGHWVHTIALINMIN